MKYPLVYVKFDDHCMGSGKDPVPFACEVFGILRNEDAKAYYIVSWVSDGELESDDSEGYCILKSTVLKFKELGLYEYKKGI